MNKQTDRSDASPGFIRTAAKNIGQMVGRYGAPLMATGISCVMAGSLLFVALSASGAEKSPVADFHKEISPILEQYCYECHGDGYDKGNVAFDALTDASLMNNDLWLKVLNNVRAGVMPAQQKTRPTPEDQQKLERWIKYDAFGIDPHNPDPGRVTVRRLNRTEYRNTIRDLMGVNYNTEFEFPADDTGYGFDTIADALTISPMLMEKYIDAAQQIVATAVPTTARVMDVQTIDAIQFRGADEPADSEKAKDKRKEGKLRLSFYDPVTVMKAVQLKGTGTYRITIDLNINGRFDYDPGRCRLIFKVDGQELFNKEFDYNDDRAFSFEVSQKWDPALHNLSFELVPLTPVAQRKNALDLVLNKVSIQGPLEKSGWVKPPNYDRFFAKPIPTSVAQQRAYARDMLSAFATKAYRRPVDAATVERLTNLAEKTYRQPGKNFQTGVSQAMIAVLASPRFLFRLEKPASSSATANTAYIDEYSLASRLSYFLWSTMPDSELMDLAARGQLRQNLDKQVQRMLADKRSEGLVQNFTGQWLQVRDVDGTAIDARAILARDTGQEKVLRAAIEQIRNSPKIFSLNDLPPIARAPTIDLDRDLRLAMQRETEMLVSTVMHEDRPVTELLDNNYTFLNEKLAKFYGISGVVGSDMRRVALPAGSPRGGVLTNGSSLVVTSNPDRTSPVKRGLFILENFLGMPPPPPPANVPALEAAERDVHDHEPTLRESLKLHRDKPLCASCHNRMDPIGLAFENFNAMGQWRDMERSQQIDAAGKLVTGETFSSVGELKKLLATDHRMDFYRCLTDKLLTYAVGRGTEYYDVETIDQIVQRLDSDDGRFSALLMGVIESAPFQKMRTKSTTMTADDAAPAAKSAKQLASNLKP
jgi:hypothetical protein